MRLERFVADERTGLKYELVARSRKHIQKYYDTTHILFFHSTQTSV